MKTRILLSALVLTLLAGCDTPTGTPAPDRAALDAGADTSTAVGRGGSFGPGH